jgi:enoyl-CoA hydratase/carnithine racemase
MYVCIDLFSALGESMKLAKSLTKFPQSALIMDKLAAVNSQLNPNSEESMRDEAVMTSLLGLAIEDIKTGVKKFQDGENYNSGVVLCGARDKIHE